MYTHRIKKSNQRCFMAAWWPMDDPGAGHREKQWPLMFIEGGQINRVNKDNLEKINKNSLVS